MQSHDQKLTQVVTGCLSGICYCKKRRKFQCLCFLASMFCICFSQTYLRVCANRMARTGRSAPLKPTRSRSSQSMTFKLGNIIEFIEVICWEIPAVLLFLYNLFKFFYTSKQGLKKRKMKFQLALWASKTSVLLPRVNFSLAQFSSFIDIDYK